MSLFAQHKQVSDMIAAEATRLEFTAIMLNDLACILFNKPRNRLTLPQSKRLLVELQVMGDDGIHPDSPLAKWQKKNTLA